MSEIIFPTFPSAFENSVLGPYWEIENRSYGQNTNIVPDGGDTINEHDILTIRYKPYETEERYYSQAAHPLGVRSFIILKAGSGVTPLGGTTSTLKTYSGFDSTAIQEVYGVKIGEFLIISENTEAEDESHIKKLVNQHLNWIFFEDIEGKEKYSKVFYDKAVLYYNLQKNGSPNSVWRDLMKLIEITIAQLWAEALNYLANKMRERFKITDSNHWNPYNDDGSQNKSYVPIFFLLGQTIDKALTEIENKVNEISVFSTDVPQIIKIGSPTVNNANDLLKNVFKDGILPFKKELYQSIDTVKDISKQLLNAFLVGLYNGVVEIVAGTLETIGQLLKLGDPKVRAKIFEAVKWVFTYIKQEGILSSLVEIFKILTLEYREAKNIYEILKTLGEDLAEIILTIILAYFTGGVSIFQKIKQFVVALKELAQKTAKGAYEAFREAVDNLKRKFKETDGSSNSDENVDAKSQVEDASDQPIDEKNKKDPDKRPNTYKKVNYGTGISKLAIEHRKKLLDPLHGGNICVVKYEDPFTKKIITKIFSTDLDNTAHAEKITIDWFKEQGLPASVIKEFYSEFEPCELVKHECKFKVNKYLNGVTIQYSFLYRGTGNMDDIIGKKIRSESRKARKKVLLKMVPNTKLRVRKNKKRK